MSQAPVDVKVEWKGYLHPEDGRICYPAPDDPAQRHRWDWRGPGDAPRAGERVFALHDSRRWPCKRSHPKQSAELPLVAVIPPRHTSGKAVHLYLPGYRPARAHPRGRQRENLHAAMCAHIGIGTIHWNITRERDEPTGREHWPVSRAVHEIARGGVLRWCPNCVGRAAEHFDLLNTTVRLALEADLANQENR